MAQFFMKYYSNNLLTFDRDPKTTGSIFSIFETLTIMQWDTATFYSVSEKTLVSVTKNPVDIIKVDFDYSKLYDEYVYWGFGYPDKIMLPFWSLDKDKTDLFLKSLEACVLYYLPRKDRLFSPGVMDDVLNLYVEIFQKKLPEFNLN